MQMLNYKAVEGGLHPPRRNNMDGFLRRLKSKAWSGIGTFVASTNIVATSIKALGNSPSLYGRHKFRVSLPLYLRTLLSPPIENIYRFRTRCFCFNLFLCSGGHRFCFEYIDHLYVRNRRMWKRCSCTLDTASGISCLTGLDVKRHWQVICACIDFVLKHCQ